MNRSDKGIRIGNYIADFLLIYVIENIVIGILYISNVTSYTPGRIDLLFYLVCFLYYFFFEAFTNQTPGKMITKTRVVDAEGNKPPLKKILIRSLLRLVYLDVFSFLFGSSGLHDELSGTAVISKKSNAIAVGEWSLYTRNAVRAR